MLATKTATWFAMIMLISILSCAEPTDGEVERAELQMSSRYGAIFYISQFSNDRTCVAMANEARYEWSRVEGLGENYVTASNQQKMADWNKYKQVLDKNEPRLKESGCL